MSLLGTARRLIDSFTDVPRALYPDPAVYWRARAMMAFLLIEAVMTAVLLFRTIFGSAEFRARMLQIVPGIMLFLLVALLLVRRVRGGLAIAGWLVVPPMAILIFLWSLSGYGLFDAAIPGYLWLVAVATILLGVPGTLLVTAAGLLGLAALTRVSLDGWQGWRFHTTVPLPRGAIEAFGGSIMATMGSTGFLLALLESSRRRLVGTVTEDVQKIEAARREAEVLAETARMKSALFNNVSHELRTPLTLAIGALEELAADDAVSGTPALRERVERARGQSGRLLRLVEALRALARAEAGRLEARYEPVDLAQFSAELCDQRRPAIEAQGLRLRLDCPPLPAPIHVDRELWEKIVGNLLSNALQFTPEGEITVSLRATPDGAELAVQDTGRGIDAEDLPKIFQRYYAGGGHRGAEEGAGVGLALVQELVRLHGGTVRVRSAPGQGTTFTVSVPFGHAHLPAAALRR